MRLSNLFGFLFVALCALLGTTQLSAQGYDLRFNIKDQLVPGDTVLLAYYYSDGKYVQDSGFVTKANWVQFKGKEPLHEGMYMVILPGFNYFEIMIGNEQQFTVQASSSNISAPDTKVKGSAIMSDFLRFQRALRTTQEKFPEIRRLDSIARAQNPDNPSETDAYKKARKEQEEINVRVRGFVDSMLEKHSENMLGKFIRSTEEITLPEPPTTLLQSTNPDSATMMWRLHYYAQHYLDNIDLSYPGMLRTPTFEHKLTFYLDKLIFNIPDTINKYCDLLLTRTNGNEQMMQFLTTFLLNKYQSSDIMGMDAVVVHLGENYFLAGKTPWLEEETLNKIRERVEALKPNLIGNKAPDFTVQDILERPFTLHQLKAKATILVFWEPNCSFCKKVIPKLDSAFRSLEPEGVAVIGFMTQGDGPKWANYIQEHELKGWYHVWDPYRKSNFDKLYDIYSTPVIYVLDSDLRIVAKRLGAEQVEPLIRDMLGLKQPEP